MSVPEPITREEMFLQGIIDAAGGGGSSVEVEPLSVAENGDYYAGEGKAYNPVNVQVAPHTESKAITSNGLYDALSEGLDGYSIVSVDVPQSTLGTKSITQNGTYNASDDNLDGYSSVTVNVPSSGSSPTQFASSGTIASPDANVTSGNLIAAAFADHKYFELSFEFGGDTYVFPVQLTTGGKGNASLVGVGGGSAMIGFIGYNISNLRLALDTVFLAQINTDGTGFVDMTSYLPTTTPATITGYYW